MRYRSSLLALILLVLLTGCSPSGPAGITISDAWVRPSPLPGGTGAAYMVIHNGGPDADILLSASTDAAAATEIHQSVHEGDMVSMHPAGELEIAVGRDVVMEPGGYHIMLIEMDEGIEPGQIVSLTLTFQNAGEIVIEAEVRAE